MCDVNDLFYKVMDTEGKTVAIEGYLGKPEECEILFVLKEPNTGGYEKQSKEFWMQSVISDSPVPKSEQYLRTLGIIAANLLEIMPEKEQIDEFYKNVLKHCAYINIYPFSGLGSEGKYYKKVKASLKRQEVRNLIHTGPCYLPEYEKTPCEESYFNAIACNRLQIIKSFNCKYVVTVCGAFEAIIGKRTNESDIGIIIEKKEFRVDKAFDKIFAAYYHPIFHKFHPKVLPEQMNVQRVIEYAEKHKHED